MNISKNIIHIVVFNVLNPKIRHFCFGKINYIMGLISVNKTKS